MMVRYTFLSRHFFGWVLLVGSILVAPTCFEERAGMAAEMLTYEKDVLPIFERRCLACHSGDEPKGGLDLSSGRGLLDGGDSGAAIRRGAAESSLLWEKIAAGLMPKKGPPLTVEEKGIIRRWINEGAVGTGDDAPVAGDSADAISDEERGFWSFQPPVRPQVPVVERAERVRNPIDAFLLAKLQEQQLSFSPEADRVTLIRRLYYDLIGLPPTPDDVGQFVGDERPDAYERLVDRLLASPNFGERWGRHWLDVAGYTDSAGILFQDLPLQNAWRYRDYVIAALNKDKPYDRFLQEQIAGDELVDYWTHFENDERLGDDVVEGVIATGYLRNAADSSRQDFSTIKNADALYYYPTLNDTIQIVSTSTLGLTLQCARCHNHMFDPIPQTDFYRMQAIFMSGYRPTSWIPQADRKIVQASKSQLEAAQKRNAEVDANVVQLKQDITKLRDQFKTRLFDDRLAQLPAAIRDDVRQSLAAPADQRSEVQKYLADKFQSTLQPDDKTLDEELPKVFSDYKPSLDKLNSDMATQEQRRYWFDEIRALYDLPGEVPTPLLRRGDALTPGPPVSPGALSVLDQHVPFEWQPPPTGAKTSGRRLALARWLTQPRHPLTARVMANRIWLHHFGEGIVSTPDDFGRAGSPPSHPELLDWLATEFVDGRWSMKHMHRIMVTSSAYRQVSISDYESPPSDASSNRKSEIQNLKSLDPDNRLLWRQRLRRLEAEPMRDAVLAVSGTLNGQLFGRPIPMARRGDGEVTTADGADPHRRSIYLQILRLTPLTMLEAFDQPMMATNCVRRSRSTVSTQALTLLNSDSMVAAAEALADRVYRECPEDPAARSVALSFSREATADERTALSEFIESQTQRHVQALVAGGQPASDEVTAKARQLAIADLCHMLLSANEFVYID